ncbi:MAG TPA: DUF2064 domain-containing protein [Gammaproteobacteria bacterium]|nr:DUF2064 domain-containing protein [Gammaproteobacteria bacterium]
MNGGAAIFVKTPGYSPLKTRLAEGIGQAAAERWYRLAAEAVAEVLAATPGVAPCWAVAEETAEAAESWPGLPCIAQGPGGLGARMGRVHAALLARHDFALLVGADTPQLEPAQLALAVEWLSEVPPRLVMGPARDGGFWLIGGNRAPEPDDWTRVPCSRASTGAGFRAVMERHGEWRMLQTLCDVDQPADLEHMLRELDALAAPLPAQRRLAEWTRGLLSRPAGPG